MLSPYSISDEHLQLVHQHGHEWRGKEIKFLADRIQDFLYEEHGNICYYCRSYLERDETYVEHILVKHNTNYKEFQYHPYNLVLSCKDCNTAKGKEDVLIQDHRPASPFVYANYPMDPEHYSIIHAYLDEYEKNIVIEDHVFYKALKPKGEETIKICNLHRLILAEKNVKRLRNFSPLGHLVSSWIKEDDYPARIESLKKILTENENLFDGLIELNQQGRSRNSLINRLARCFNEQLPYYTQENVDFIHNVNKMAEDLNNYLELTQVLTGIKKELGFLNGHILRYANPQQRLLNEDGLKVLYDSIGTGPFTKGQKEKILEHLSPPIKVPILISRLENKEDREKIQFLLTLFIELLSDSSIQSSVKGIEQVDYDLVQKVLSKMGAGISRNTHLVVMQRLEFICTQILNGMDIKDLRFTRNTINKFLKKVVFPGKVEVTSV